MTYIIYTRYVVCKSIVKFKIPSSTANGITSLITHSQNFNRYILCVHDDNYYAHHILCSKHMEVRFNNSHIINFVRNCLTSQKYTANNFPA